MSFKIKFTDTAKEDLRNIATYIAEQSKDKKIAISFDCAWGVDHTDALLDIMAQNEVVCTFFAVEFWVKKYPEYVQKIIDAFAQAGRAIGIIK